MPNFITFLKRRTRIIRNRFNRSFVQRNSFFWTRLFRRMVYVFSLIRVSICWSVFNLLSNCSNQFTIVAISFVFNLWMILSWLKTLSVISFSPETDSFSELLITINESCILILSFFKTSIKPGANRQPDLNVVGSRKNRIT